VSIISETTLNAAQLSPFRTPLKMLEAVGVRPATDAMAREGFIPARTERP